MTDEILEGQVSMFGPVSSSGRMSPEHSAPTKEQTSGVSSKSTSKLKTVVPMFLCLRTGNGQMRDASLPTDVPCPGGCWMRNIGEFHSADGESFSLLHTGSYPTPIIESTLSSILQLDAPQKYYLSEKACIGILRRAEKRKKELPPILRKALERQAGIA